MSKLENIHQKEMLIDVIDTMPIGLVILDDNYHFVNFNPFFEKMVEYSSDELSKLTMLDITHPEDREISLKLKESLCTFEKRLIKKSGEIFWVRITSQKKMNFDNSKFENIFKFIEDISEIKKKEFENITKTKRIQRLIDGIPSLVSYWDKNYKNIVANNKYTLRFGKTPEEMVGMHVKDVIGKIFETSKPFMDKALMGEVATLHSELTNNDGSREYYQVTFSPDFENNQVIGFFTIAVNITSLKKSQNEIDVAQKELQNSENYLRFILNSVHEGIWGLNLQGEVTFINKLAIKILGYADESEIIGKPMHALVHHSRADGSPYFKEECPMYDSFKNVKIHHIKNEVLWKKNGESFPVSYYSAPIIKDDHCVGSVVSFQDLTQTKKLETELETERIKSISNAKFASLGEMSAGIAHEINNPLAIIFSSLELLPRFFHDTEKLNSKISSMKKSCERIKKIVAGLKKFSRTGDKKEYTPITIYSIIKEVIALTDPKSKRHNTPVTLDCKSKAIINCNEIEIEQVFVNFINNAIDAVKTQSERWVNLLVKEEVDTIVIQIIDSGPGIPEKVRNKIFEPFFTTKKVGEGTGLGLSISKGIIQEHGGTVDILDNFKNTCFEIKFPKVNEVKKHDEET